ncbi:MAG: autotransporter-associated beta strand repeat-containing protein [Phreatobacter sp.]|uniref:beta strand repeat-containing protein n=1 Tax=Phreatobacter sp. TaxID=1966341 RepID=UPI0027330B25|nr:autotransporter-associated beta strand repeat-containing protein [Phreatobacter sp.]MDP2802551.1 autotransporter-associated beta strand repeat-containing protein [Phreatobacter sp.]
MPTDSRHRHLRRVAMPQRIITFAAAQPWECVYGFPWVNGGQGTGHITMATWTGAINSNWSNAGNWSGGILPSPTEGAAISAGNVTVDTTGLTASLVSVFINKTVDVGAGGGLTVGGVFEIFNGSSLVARNGGSVSANSYNVAGNLIVGGAGAAEASGTVTGAVNLSAASGKLTFNTTNALFLSQVISGAGSVEQKGPATTITLTGANTYSGATTISAGTLEVQNGNAIGNSSAVTVFSGGRLVVTASETIGSLAGPGSVLLANNSTLTTGGNNATTDFGGTISETGGIGNLTKIGTGTLVLHTGNTYSGTTTVSVGVLQIEEDSALGTTAGGTTVTGGAALQLIASSIADPIGEALTLNGTGISNGGALRNLSGTHTWTGGITLGSETRINSDTFTLSLNGGITGTNQNLILGAGINSTIAVNSAITTGSGTLTKDGTGTVILGGVNTYTGTTTVNDGDLFLRNGNAIADTSAVIVNAAGMLRHLEAETIGSLAGSGRVLVASNASLTTGADNTSTTFSGVIESFGGGFEKTGTGTFTLSGVNTYNAITRINNGTLALAGAGSIANSFELRLMAPGAIFDISAISGGVASIRDISFLGAGTINLGSKSLLVTHANGDFGTGTINGGAGANALTVTMDAAATGVSLAGLAFTTWTDGTDTIAITGNGLANTIFGSTRADSITAGAGNDTILGGGGNDIITGGADSDGIDGGSGADTALFSGARANYFVRSFVSNGQTFTQVSAASGTDGVDTLVSIEVLGFNNGAQAFGLAGIQQNLVSNMDGSFFDDVLFQNSATGQVAYVNMNAGAAGGFTNLLSTLPAGWRLVGSDDFTGDGRADTLIQDTNTGSIYTVNIASGAPVWGVVNVNLTASYRAIASGDVTRDGTTDVLVRDNTTGINYIADMEAGGTFGGWVLGTSLGIGWRTIGLGDFNRDGASDVLVQDIGSGTTYYRDIANGQWGTVSGAIGAQWVAREAADLNGDGYADVVFRNTSTSDIWWVDMLGGTNAGFNVIANGLAGWDVRGSADVDNDGYRDVIVQNLADGTTYFADMNNGTFGGFGTVSGALGTQWLAVA